MTLTLGGNVNGLSSIRGSFAAAALAFAGLALAAAPARAGEKPKQTRIAVLDVRATGAIDARSVSALSAMVASEAERFPAKVFSGSDLQTLLGFERQKALLGCSDSSCLAEIGGALGVDYLLSTEVGEFGGRWLLTISVLDTKKATAVRRATKTAKVQGELVDLVGPTVTEALKDLPGIKVEAVAQPEPVAQKQPEPQPQPPPVAEDPKPSPQRAPEAATAATADAGSAQRTAGWALLGGGAALLVGGGISGILAMLDTNAAKSNPPATQAEVDSARAKVKSEMLAADVLYGVGAAAAVAGLVVALTAPSAPAAQPSASIGFAPVAGGGALCISGGF